MRNPAPTVEPAEAAEATVEPAGPTLEPAQAEEPAPTAPARRRVFVTGATGFIGRAIVRHLLDRGDEVVAPVRDPARARDLAEAGVELTAGDVGDVPRLTDDMRGADAAIHAAGSHRVGIAKGERGSMWSANVGTTTSFLDAAEAARVPRQVYLSTVNVFGNTRGRIVSEGYRRNLADDFLSWYDETKYGAHEVAEQRAAGGAPLVIVLPSLVYGPGDRSDFGRLLRLAFEGRLRYRAVDDVGIGLVHVDDLVTGILVALDRGTAGESYVLSGPTTRLRDAIDLAARIGGHAPPVLRLPTSLLHLLAPVAGAIAQRNVREMITAAAGVTYWASSAKAEAELGFRPRDLETGLRDAFLTLAAAPVR